MVAGLSCGGCFFVFAERLAMVATYTRQALGPAVQTIGGFPRLGSNCSSPRTCLNQLAHGVDVRACQVVCLAQRLPALQALRDACMPVPGKGQEVPKAGLGRVVSLGSRPPVLVSSSTVIICVSTTCSCACPCQGRAPAQPRLRSRPAPTPAAAAWRRR